ncbi:MAG: hypothetical protein PUC50_04280 [Bacteroidales bacterium]|nr:hypothetical protein [Bacteroidales bacterium]
MLTYSMTPVDLFNNYLQDKEKIFYWIEKNKPKIIKTFATTYSFPKYYVEDYKHTISGTDYLLLYYQQKPKSDLQIDFMATCSLENKKFFISFRYCPDVNKKEKKCTALPKINLYNGHFFERFKERYLKDESLLIKDIIGKYFAQLTTINCLEINDEIIKDWKEKYGDFSAIFYTNLGVCLGNNSICQPPNLPFEKGKANEVVVHEYKTFLSFDMLSEKQKEAIKEEGLKYFDRYIEHINDLYEVGAIKK